MSNIWDKAGTRLAVVVIAMFAAVLFFWWYTLSDYRAMTATVQDLQGKMQAMQRHVLESQRLLKALDSLKQEVRDARVQSNIELEDSCRLAGNERLDYLVRLLETDLARRGSLDSSHVTSGSVPGTGGSVGGSGASPRKAP